MISGICRTCRFWRPTIIEHWQNPDKAEDTPEAREAAVWGTCTMPDEIEPGDAPAFVKDASDFHATLHTKPTLGCLSFRHVDEAKIRHAIATAFDVPEDMLDPDYTHTREV